MRLEQYLRPDLVLTGLTAAGVEPVIRRLAQHLGQHGAVPSESEAEAGLLARERAHSTALGQGMALPHATIEGLPSTVLMVAVAPDAVPFGPPEADPVRVFFVLLSPPGRENEHIKLLARICRLVRHPGFVDELQAAADGERVLEVIRRADEQHV